MTTLENKVVAVTGAGSGIGRALAQRLVERGAHVAISDVAEKPLEETAAKLADSATRVTSHQVDVSDRAAVERYAQEVKDLHGGVDVVINNAGVAARGTLEEMSYEHLSLVIDVNLWGVLHGIKSFLPLLRERPAGHIVNISSINAFVPFIRNGPYNAAKAAVLSLSETLMQELSGSSVRVSVVHPGGIRTNIVRNGVGMGRQEVDFFDKVARTSASSAAEQILRGVERNQERIYVGADAKLMQLAKRLIPRATVAFVGKTSSYPGPAS